MFFKWKFNIFPIFFLHHNFSKNFYTKRMKAWGHKTMRCILFIYAFNMCGMKNCNMNKKSNALQQKVSLYAKRFHYILNEFNGLVNGD